MMMLVDRCPVVFVMVCCFKRLNEFTKKKKRRKERTQFKIRSYWLVLRASVKDLVQVRARVVVVKRHSE